MSISQVSPGLNASAAWFPDDERLMFFFLAIAAPGIVSHARRVIVT